MNHEMPAVRVESKIRCVRYSPPLQVGVVDEEVAYTTNYHEGESW